MSSNKSGCARNFKRVKQRFSRRNGYRSEMGFSSPLMLGSFRGKRTEGVPHSSLRSTARACPANSFFLLPVVQTDWTHSLHPFPSHLRGCLRKRDRELRCFYSVFRFICKLPALLFFFSLSFGLRVLSLLRFAPSPSFSAIPTLCPCSLLVPHISAATHTYTPSKSSYSTPSPPLEIEAAERHRGVSPPRLL